MSGKKIIKGLKQAVRHARGEDPIKVPIHIVGSLAECLQFEQHKDYGQLLSCAQIEKAERILRRWYKTQ